MRHLQQPKRTVAILFYAVLWIRESEKRFIDGSPVTEGESKLSGPSTL